MGENVVMRYNLDMGDNLYMKENLIIYLQIFMHSTHNPPSTCTYSYTVHIIHLQCWWHGCPHQLGQNLRADPHCQHQHPCDGHRGRRLVFGQRAFQSQTVQGLVHLFSDGRDTERSQVGGQDHWCCSSFVWEKCVQSQGEYFEGD